MIEMMEPTDFAVRIEFERGGYVLPESARFMNRGIDFAVSMFDFKRRSVETIRRDQFAVPLPLPIEGAAERRSLFDKRYTPCFRAEKLLVHGDASLRQSGLRVLIVTNGSGELEINGKYCKLSAYDRILIPAKTEEIRLYSEKQLELIAALPPEA